MADYGGPKQFGGSFLVILQVLLELNRIHSTYVCVYIYIIILTYIEYGMFNDIPILLVFFNVRILSTPR